MAHKCGRSGYIIISLDTSLGSFLESSVPSALLFKVARRVVFDRWKDVRLTFHRSKTTAKPMCRSKANATPPVVISTMAPGAKEIVMLPRLTLFAVVNEVTVARYAMHADDRG